METNANVLYPNFFKWNNITHRYFHLRIFLLITSFLLSASVTVFGQKNYQHWADGDAATGSTAEWNNNILNANKSDYFEGEVIPHVANIPASNNTPLVQNTEYTFTVVYNFYQANTNAGGFAFITTYNISRSPGAFAGVTPALDPSGHSGTGSQGVFYVGPGVDVISAAAPVTTGTGTKDQTVTITFKWTAATTTSGSAKIFYGLFISDPARVPNQGAGATNGAHLWTGGSLQTTLNSTFTGGLSLQLAPSAIIAGTISGVKFKDLDKDATKDAGEPLLSGWTIYLDLDNDGVKDAGEPSQVTDANGAYSFSVTPDANKNTAGNDPYIVREELLSGWTQTKPAAGFYSVTITSIAPISANNDFGNFICVNPTISTPAIGTVCAGATSASVSYASVTGSPDQYKIDWDATAEAAGLTDIAYTNLPASPFNITIPGTLAAGTYNGTIYVKNSTTGCESAGDAISLTVNANATAGAGDAPAAQCLDAVNGNTFSLDGSGSNGTPKWTVKTNANGLTVLFSDDAIFKPTVTLTGGTGSVTLTLTVTSNTTPACSNATSDVTVTVNDKPDQPDVTYVGPTCTQTTFKVEVNSPAAGTYVLKQMNGDSYTKTAPADVVDGKITFDNLVIGQGYSVTVESGDNCKSDANECGDFSEVTAQRSSVVPNNSATLTESQTSVKAYPNPFNNKVKFVITAPQKGKGTLEVFNVMGQKVQTVFQGTVNAGSNNFELTLPNQNSNLIYRFRMGEKQITGKLLQINR